MISIRYTVKLWTVAQYLDIITETESRERTANMHKNSAVKKSVNPLRSSV